ncbi:hypothetical protein CTRI78_v011519 [Colletotrichum trifolii]|uniref:F-box domain-containing protein n=1 Tax=Colletotrichum trifolii TaxID=5466 RepID=A0A4R8QE94_COLTR|nr:hypothetical protein CTRI78_v011519 [Colletotrichum trifolii]
MDSTVLAPSPIPYRSDGDLSRKDVVYTGYYQSAKCDRHVAADASGKDLTKRLPLEIWLDIMDYLGLDDLYFLRQTSRLFVWLFSHQSFALFRCRGLVPEPDNRPKEVPKLREWLSATRTSILERLGMVQSPRQSEPAASSASRDVEEDQLPRTWARMDEFNLSQLSLQERDKVQSRLVEYSLCQSCKSSKPTPNNAPLEKQMLYCYGCKRTHMMTTWFSDGRLADEPKCIAWEGKLRLCPHRHISLADEIVWRHGRSKTGPIEKCGRCVSLMKDVWEAAPTLSYYDQESTLAHDWSLTVCTIPPGSILTKEKLISGLRGLAPLNDILCPHVSFQDDSLMRPFEWGRCTCFQDPSSPAGSCHTNKDQHRGFLEQCCCCACGNLSNPASFGKFTNPRPMLHGLTCKRCPAEYTWVLRGRKVMLSMHRELRCFLMFQKSRGRATGRLDVRLLDLPGWLLSLDPQTFVGNDASRRYASCEKETCLNPHHTSSKRSSSVEFDWLAPTIHDEERHLAWTRSGWVSGRLRGVYVWPDW